MKLWCFLHAFQRSPFRYLYLSSVIKALESCFPREPDLDSVIHYLESLYGPQEAWWRKIQDMADEIEDEERLVFNPDRHRFIFYGQREFPVVLMNSSNPPLALSVEGNMSPFVRPCISVVGSREPHDYTKIWMQKEFYGFLKQYRVPVISGGARGVDQLAHKIALLMKVPTLVVMPSGLGKKYPNIWENSDEWTRQGAAFVSEMRLGSTVAKQNFSSRNRLIAAWGIASLIVEARAKSGTLITAHYALIEGRSVCVVPAHPCLTQFAGSLQLLAEGASFVKNALDLGDYFESEFQMATGTNP